MSHLNMGELERALMSPAAQARPPRVTFPVPVRPVGYRDGSFPIVPPRSPFDTSLPSLPVPQWTPWGEAARVAPGTTMERF